MVDAIEQHRPQLEALCEKYRVTRLAVIGSAIRADFRTGVSDIDLVVEFSNLAPADAADRYFGLLNDLQDLLACKVDLISYTAIRNPYFKQVVDRTRVPLSAA